MGREKIFPVVKKLCAFPEFIKAIIDAPEKEFAEPIDAEAALYDGFLSDSDRTRVEAVRNTEPSKLAGFSPDFQDKRLPELLLHYKGRNFPSSLSEAEAAAFADYRNARLNRQAVGFMKALERLQASGDADEFILEELGLWFQGLQE